MTIRNRMALLFVLLFAALQGSIAAPRTLSQMKAAAQAALKSHARTLGANKELKAILTKEQVALIGYNDGPYAVVAADDRFPAVLGVSKTPYSGGANANFEFWLKAMSGALAYRVQHNMPAHIITPDPAFFPASVEPLCSSFWDQLTPYNNLLPSGIYTGCVATAMAQVLYYHKAPEHGTGTRTIQAKGTPVTANFEEDYYDWDNMLDVYRGNYSDEEGNAVALLMRDCGVAANMNYGNAWDGGSGAYSQDAASGLRTYLNMPEAECKERDRYSDTEWMEMVFNELAFVGPLYYGGTDMQLYSGHAFVLHGYNEEGLVYVNWGWSGDDDGFFDISLLNPPGYKFSAGQDMIIGVHGDLNARASRNDTIQMEQAGQLLNELAELVPADSLNLIAGLKVSGPINGADLLTLRSMAGCDEEMNMFRGTLRSLDLSEATFVGGGGHFINTGSRQISTAANRLPELAFYGCRSLGTLILPKNIVSIGKGAFAMCTGLNNLVLPEANDSQEYILEDQTLYLKTDPNTIYEVLPTAKGAYEVVKGHTAVADYAFSGCSKITKIHLPSTVTEIGNSAFQGCSGLKEFKLAHKEVPQTGTAALEGVNFNNAILYVRAGMKDNFRYHSEWGKFGKAPLDNIKEFGSAVTARNAGRDYGEENPRFGYQYSGDRPNGTPALSCDADIYSPVGKYVIHVEPGTITDEVVDYYDGTLTIWKAKLKVSVGDYERFVGQENPEFELTYDGFKLGETPDVLTRQPVATTTATIDSPEGEYPITISGGEAQNYEFRYHAGVLKVVADPSGITELRNSDKTFDVYTVDGIRVGQGISLQTLSKGVYVVNGHKIVIK